MSNIFPLFKLGLNDQIGSGAIIQTRVGDIKKSR